MPVAREWRCSCGSWLPFAYGRHPHIKSRDRTLHEMVMARMGGDVEPLYDTSETTYEWRTPDHLTREIY